MTIVIGLAGPKGAGKTTVADYLVKNYGAKKYCLAAPLKDLAMRVFDLTYEQVYGTQEQKETVDPRYGFTPRWLLQRLGTEGFRAVFGVDFWVDHLLRVIDEERPKLAVIEDVRFKNEAELIRRPGVTRWGFVWRIDPVDYKQTYDHQSEEEWRELQYDSSIMPTMKGTDILFKLVDNVCQYHGIHGQSFKAPRADGFKGEF